MLSCPPASGCSLAVCVHEPCTPAHPVARQCSPVLHAPSSRPTPPCDLTTTLYSPTPNLKEVWRRSLTEGRITTALTRTASPGVSPHHTCAEGARLSRAELRPCGQRRASPAALQRRHPYTTADRQASQRPQQAPPWRRLRPIGAAGPRAARCRSSRRRHERAHMQARPVHGRDRPRLSPERRGSRRLCARWGGGAAQSQQLSGMGGAMWLLLLLCVAAHAGSAAAGIGVGTSWAALRLPPRRRCGTLPRTHLLEGVPTSLGSPPP